MLLNLNVVHARSTREVSARVSFLWDNRLQLCNFTHNVLSQKTMLKVSNRNTRKRCRLISKITLKTSGRRHLTTNQLFAGGNCLEPCLGQFFREYMPIFNQKSTFSLFSSSTTRNFDNSRLIYVILWEIRNHYRNIWSMKIQNVSIFLFLKKTAPKTDKSFNFLPYIQRHFSITKLDILILCNILHLKLNFWNMSWKRIVS